MQVNSAQQPENGSKIPRYDPSIYATPFSKLPDPKRVWLGASDSSLEGIGTFQNPRESEGPNELRQVGFLS